MSKQVFGTKEWAVANVNFVDGCSHNCKYCYSQEMAIRFGRKSPQTWHKEVIRTKAVEKNYKCFDGQVMVPSSHDITPIVLEEAILVISKILTVGNNVLIVTKPHLVCVHRLCQEFKDYKQNILFRFTIGSMDDEALKFWEPGAPEFSERFDCLKLAFNNGFNTSVSCEPFLDNKIVDLVHKLYPYVSDSLWIGKANMLMKRISTNGYHDPETISQARELVEWQADPHNINSIYTALIKFQKVKWKESIKKVVGLQVSCEIGSDN